jgi:hypothetical protein
MRSVDYYKGTADLYTIEKMMQKTATTEHVPLLKLIRTFGAEGTGVSVAMIGGCDYGKTEQ